jgi:Domain of unknown function (DUF4833)
LEPGIAGVPPPWGISNGSGVSINGKVELPKRTAGHRNRIADGPLHQLAVLAALLWMSRAYLLGAGVELSQPLFIIEKSTNANAVHYDAVITPDGGLNPRQPIIAYWVMAAEDGRREDLTLAERRKAFGFTIVHGWDANSYHLRLVAQQQRDIYVRRNGNSVRAETLIAGRCAYLTKIYVKVHKVLALPRIEFIELFGSDIATGEPVCERVRL